MKSFILSPVALLSVSLMALPVVLSAAEAVTSSARGVMKTLDLRAGAPFRPKAETLKFDDKPAAGAPALPEGLANAHWSMLNLGAKDVALAVAKKGTNTVLYEVLLIDSDGNKKFSEAEQFAIKATERPFRAGQTMSMGSTDPIQLSSASDQAPFTFEYRDAPALGFNGQVAYSSYLEVPVKFGNDSALVAVLDNNRNGKYGDESDLWVINTGSAWGKQPAQEYALSGVNEGRFVDGFRYTIKIDPEQQVTVTRAAATGPADEDLAKQRKRVEHVWSARFDNEKEKFLKDRQVETDRPRAEEPVHWHYVTFDEAQALAKKMDKPLFVDVMAFWCVWCYRMDYYTYVDREVAKTLNEKFVPVKIIQEQDPANDYKRIMGILGARGIPAMGIWNPAGEKVHYISGWKKPTDFLAELEKGLHPVAK